MTNEVKILIVYPGETGEPVNGDGPVIKSANLTAAAYDLDIPGKAGGRKLEKHEMPETLPEFVEEVLGTVGPLAQQWVVDWAEAMRADESLTDTGVFAQILVGFLDKPIELIGNMLAAMITECAESIAYGADYEATIAEIKTHLQANQQK